MANTLRIKRRASGATGAPTTSQCVNAELAFNEVDGILYYGLGGNETASSIVKPIAGLEFQYLQGLTGDGGVYASKALVFDSTGAVNSTLNLADGNLAFTAGNMSQKVSGFGTLEFYEGDWSSAAYLKVATSVSDTGPVGRLYTNRALEVTDYASDDTTVIGTYQVATRKWVGDRLAELAGATTQYLSVKAASTANVTTLSGTTTIDGRALVAGDRVLLKNQTTGSQNGIYVIAAGAWTRATDLDTTAEVAYGNSTYVEYGTTNGGKTFAITNTSFAALGTTAMTWAETTSVSALSAGAGMTRTGNVFNVISANTGRIVVNADNIDLATTGVTASTYKSVTVDTYGRVTGGTNPTTLSGYGITDAQPLDADLTAIAALAGTTGLLKKTAADTWTLDTSTYLTTNQSITLSGDASGSGTTAITVTLANSGVTAGTYRSVTVDAKGRVTGGTNPTTFSGYAISDSSANLAAALTDETGFTTGAKAVFSTSPSFETSVVTSSTSFDVFNTTATTVNAFGAATSLTIGSTTATNTVNLATGATGGGNTKTVNIGTAGTAGSITNVNIGSATIGSTTNVTIGGAASGSTHTITGNVNFAGSSQAVAVQTGMTFRVDSGATAAFNNGGITTNATTMSVFNLNATTVNAFGAATAITMGDATAATTTIRGGTLVGNTTTQAVFNTTATTVNAFGAATAVSIGAGSGNTTVNNNLIVTGNLTINGTTTTVNSTTVTVDDPIFTLGGDTAPASNDNKDRGIEFRWHNGTAAKVGFFGYDASASAFTFIPDATNASEVFSGTAGDVLFGKVNKVTITAPATGSTLTIADGKTLTASNTLTFAGTDSTTMTFPSSSTTVAGLSIGNAFTGANTFTNATGQTYRPAATQDGIIILGRAGGTSSYAVTLTTATLTANRTITLPDAGGTLLTTGSICSDIANCTLDGGTF